MEKLLAPYKCFQNVRFIKAVDRKKLSEEDCSQLVRQEEAYKLYGRYLKRTEVGCTLSHRNCYQEHLDSEDQVAFIMEDDILFRETHEVAESLLIRLLPLLHSQTPMMILLFGEYWWLGSQRIDDKFQLKQVYDAISTQGYLVNRPAAEVMLKKQAVSLADDWAYIISEGVNVKAVSPHMIDQEWNSFETTVSMDGNDSLVRKNLSTRKFLQSYWRGGIKHLLKAVGPLRRTSSLRKSRNGLNA